MATLKSLSVDDTGFIKLPSGTTAQRPSSPTIGMMRFNTDLNCTEYYDNINWIDVKTGAPTIVTDGLILHLDASIPVSYPGGGDIWTDLSGNQYNFTIYGSPTFNSSGYFTFSNDQITQYIMRYPFETPTVDITYSCWYRSNFNSTQQTPFTYSVSGNNEMLFFNNNSTQLAPHPKSVSYPINTTNMQNVWVNFSWTRKTSTGENVFYRDGQYIDDYTASAGTSITSGGHMIIGQEADSAGGGFSATQNLDGDFAILQVYDRVLTATEIEKNFDSLKDRFGL